MTKNTLFELTLFDPDNTLIALLKEQNIAFRKVPNTQQFLVATDETIELINQKNTEALIESLVLIFVTWLKDKTFRKLQVQLVDGSTVYLNEYDDEKVVNLLKNTLKVSAFDPEYNNKIRNR